MRVIGIDPGKFGAVARIETGHAGLCYDAQVEDLPLITDKTLYWIDGLRLMDVLRRMAPDVAVIERVSSMRNQGVSSSFHFGVVFGSILSVLQAAHIRIELVTPVTWKKWHKIPGGDDKNPALNKARLLFPLAPLARKKDHNRAEALLMADWYCRTALKLPQTQTGPALDPWESDELKP